MRGLDQLQIGADHGRGRDRSGPKLDQKLIQGPLPSRPLSMPSNLSIEFTPEPLTAARRQIGIPEGPRSNILDGRGNGSQTRRGSEVHTDLLLAYAYSTSGRNQIRISCVQTSSIYAINEASQSNGAATLI